MARAEEASEVPAELQAAVDAGDVNKVKELLKTPPEGMSKSKVKKLLKDSEIAQKKVQKTAGKGGAAAPPPPAQEKKARPESAPAKAASSAAPAPVALATGHETPQDTIVVDLLEFLKSRVTDDTLAEISKLKSEMSGAIMPQVNSLRNAAYTEGFTAR